MEDDLDAELLAVTDARKSVPRSSADVSSDSENGEFDGIADSDGDDDKLDGGEDDDPDDDDEFDLDDDYRDDDYGSKQKKSSRSSKSKSSAKIKRPSKPRAKPSDRKNAKSNKSTRSVDREDDGDHFEYKYDQDGYGDAADRERLEKMNEVDRELVLADRQGERNRQFLLWEKKREMMARRASSGDNASNRARSSARSKQSSKADALDALAQDIRKKSAVPVDMDGVDADSEGEPEPKREPKRASVREDEKADAPMRDDEGPELRFSDLVKSPKDGKGMVTTPLFLRRGTVEHLSQQPYFARVVEGLYVRIKVGETGDTGSYILCRIAGVQKMVKVYDLTAKGLKTNFQLVLQSGKTRKPFHIAILSASHPTERDFQSYRERAVLGGIEIPRRDEVERLLKRAYSTIVKGKVTATETEMKEHLENTEVVYPRRVNWTQKRTSAQTALEIKRQELNNARDKGRKHLIEKYEGAVRELEDRLRHIRKNESIYGQQSIKTNAEVFQSLAARNMLLNSKNDTLAQSRKNLDSNTTTIDPYARFETTGDSYYSMDKKRTPSKMADGEMEEDVEEVPVAEALPVNDWRTYLSSSKIPMKRRRIGKTPVDPAFGVLLPGLDAFTDEKYMERIVRKMPSFVPPGLDAVYDTRARPEPKLPKGAKIISFEEWSKQRAT